MAQENNLQTDTDESSDGRSTSSNDKTILGSSLRRMYEKHGIRTSKSQSAKLCGKCFDVIVQVRKCRRSKGINSFAEVGHYETYSTVQLAARGGCVLCGAFIQATTATKRTRAAAAVVTVEWYEYTKDSCYLRLQHESLGGDVAGEIVYFDSFDADLREPREPREPREVTYETQYGPAYSKFVNLARTEHPELDYSTYKSTRDALPFCKTWLDHCNLHHKDCQGDSGVLPTRLVAVGGSNIRLCLRDEIQDQSAKYATLSHCWGDHEFLTLTQGNLDSLRQQIAMRDLTKTFQEAILTARYLGIHYIWIDSLCIIQDSLEDWQHEASRMADVYSNGTVNIAATSAVDGRDGLFFARPANWRYQVRFSSSSQDGSAEPELFDCQFQDWGSAKIHALTKRAWAIQERCLSQRTIHFTKWQVFWECNGGHYCESGPSGYASSRFKDWRPEHTIESYRMRRRSPSMRTWCNIVQTYTECRLTRRSDKLAAIAGFAKAVQKSLQGPTRYIAGMWEYELYRQLSWQTKDPGTRETSVRSPSWSWSSVDAVIESYFHGNREVVYVDNFQLERPVRVESIDVQYLSPADEFGSVNFAILRLRCQYLYHGKVQPFRSANSSYVRYNFDCPGDTDAALRALEIQWDLKDFCASENMTAVEVHLFPLVSYEKRGRKESSSQGLVLTPSRGQGQYERVGYYEVDDQYMDLAEKSSAGADRKMPSSWLGGWDYKGSSEKFEIADCVLHGKDSHFSSIKQDHDGIRTFYIDII